MTQLIDAHVHLQAAAVQREWESVVAGLQEISLGSALVNGTSPDDWAKVADLSAKYKWVIPSFGLHPWFVDQAKASWETELVSWLDRNPYAGVGEIGLDKWYKRDNFSLQKDCFLRQLQIAASQSRSITIHCLKAWGALLELLQAQERILPQFLLHSYSGPEEMIPDFVELGAYFSFSGYFLHPEKSRQRELFKMIPEDRILLETDAPDMCLPTTRQQWILKEGNHPANLYVVYLAYAEIYGYSLGQLKQLVETNFKNFFPSSHGFASTDPRE